MARVVTFGEIMLRLKPPGYERIVQARSFDVIFGGAEANVAVSLANFGVDAAFVTKLPDNPVGQMCCNELRRYGVDVSGVVRGGERTGIFYFEQGAASRPSQVIYDRAGSAIALSGPAEFDWAAILSGADWFHFTGITPALGDNVADAAMQACIKAKELGIPVSCDVNYRSKLWSREKAGRVMEGFMPYLSLLVSPADIFDLPEGAEGDFERGCRILAAELHERYGIRYVAQTLREGFSASENAISGLLYDGKEFQKSRRYDMQTIVDRVGSGDAFTAGLIFRLLGGEGTRSAVEFATAAAALKHTVEGDMNLVSSAEVMALLKGGAAGRVQR